MLTALKMNSPITTGKRVTNFRPHGIYQDCFQEREVETLRHGIRAPLGNLERTGNHMAKLKLKEHLINRDWCKGCGICVHFCPKKVLELDDQEKVVAARPQDCVCCKLCELRCPDLAIEVQTEQD
jgi:2-oxoglutarate ferredoxin oxidoreductase subunit delta